MLAYRSFYTPLQTINKFHKAGYDTVCVFPAHTKNSLGEPYSQYQPTWIWYDKIDFSPFDKMMEDVNIAMPGCKVICMIDLNSPVWLEHNEWTSVCDSFNNLGRAVHNPRWLEATENYLDAFVRYANEKYKDRILAYLLAAGATDEWYDYSLGAECADRRRAFREYCATEGKADPIDIPPISVRENCPHENFLRNPSTDSVAIDYWRFCNISIADTIIKFAKRTRDIVGKEVDIGTFYGYILEKSDNALVSCGHLEYERVLDSGLVDFLISPGTYTDRMIGGGSGFLIPSGTAAVRGKRLFHECDQRTHTYNPYLTPYVKLEWEHWQNERETIAGIKRECALALTKNTHLWWFDMWGGYFEGEAVMDTLSRVKEIWDYLPERDALDTACEVALIVDPDSTYLVNQDHERTPEMNLGMRNKLNRLGAPFEVYSFDDIPLIPDFDRYKLVIFTSLFKVDGKKEKIINEYVKRAGRHVLWLYAPGIYTNGVFDVANCERLTGIPYKSEGITSLCGEEYTSHYVYEYADVTVELLRELARESGVRMTVDAPVPVYANGNILAVHTKDGGKMKVNVDKRYTRATELFSGSISEIRDGSFVYDFASPDTAVFRLD